MKLFEEMQMDMDFINPAVYLGKTFAIIENVKSIVLVSETSVTVQCGKEYVTISGNCFVLKEIFEGRLWLEGNIQGVEFLDPSGENQNRRLQDR